MAYNRHYARNLGDRSSQGDRQNFSENREAGVVRLCLMIQCGDRCDRCDRCAHCVRHGVIGVIGVIKRIRHGERCERCVHHEVIVCDRHCARNLGDQGDRQNFSENREVGCAR